MKVLVERVGKTQEKYRRALKRAYERGELKFTGVTRQFFTYEVPPNHKLAPKDKSQ